MRVFAQSGCGHFLDTERKVSFTFKESAIGRTTDTARVFGRLSRACVCVCACLRVLFSLFSSSSSQEAREWRNVSTLFLFEYFVQQGGYEECDLVHA